MADQSGSDYETVLKKTEIFDPEAGSSDSPDFLRIVSWNIEKGKRWSALEACLELDEVRSADVLCLSEVDDGMARSGNRRIAFEIAKLLGLRAVFGPVFLEFTKGIYEERLAEGENQIGMQGNAILTRLPILGAENVRLPLCYDALESEEKRAGSRRALVVRSNWKHRPLTIVSTHLEDHTTPAGRRLQMKTLLESIGKGPAIVAGDFNTNTFPRGAAWRTFRSLVRLLLTDVRRSVLAPWHREPLFQDLEQAGFSWDAFNDVQPTALADLARLNDKKYVPAFLRRLILARVSSLPLKLDWIVVRGLRPSAAGRTLHELPAMPSDHLPILSDVVWEK